MSARYRDLVVAGASAGGVEALAALAAGLPADLPAAVVVVLHLPAGGTSALARILDRVCPLPVRNAADGVPLTEGIVYVAPPNHHLLVVDGRLALSHGPTENGHRPAINALFRSAAIAAGPRVIGVMLSGVLDDGVAGLVSIVARGGLAVVQDPADAQYSGMPERVLEQLTTEYVMPAAKIGSVLGELTRQPVVTEPAPAASQVRQDRAGDEQPDDADGPTANAFSCPDCQGVLLEVAEAGGEYRCRVGHSWSADALLAAQGESLERALWTALRTLEEKRSLAERMRDKAMDRGGGPLVQRYQRMSEETHEAGLVLRRHLASLLRVGDA